MYSVIISNALYVHNYSPFEAKDNQIVSSYFTSDMYALYKCRSQTDKLLLTNFQDKKCGD